MVPGNRLPMPEGLLGPPSLCCLRSPIVEGSERLLQGLQPHTVGVSPDRRVSSPTGHLQARRTACPVGLDRGCVLARRAPKWMWSAAKGMGMRCFRVSQGQTPWAPSPGQANTGPEQEQPLPASGVRGVTQVLYPTSSILPFITQFGRVVVLLPFTKPWVRQSSLYHGIGTEEKGLWGVGRARG